MTWQSWQSTFEVPEGISPSRLHAQVHPPSPGYCRRDLSSLENIGNQAVCGGSASDIGEMITIEWHQDCDEYGSFRIGYDWGRGGGIIIDHELVVTVPSNAAQNWWAGNWNQGLPNVATVEERVFFKGWHKVQFIGFEGCCDGNGQIQYKPRNGDWQVVDRMFRFGSCEAVPGVALTWQSWETDDTAGSTVPELQGQVKEPQNTLYCKATLTSLEQYSNQLVCKGAPDHIGEMLTIEWYQLCDQYGQFRVGVDWGRGGGIILDGELVVHSTEDGWWSGNWEAGAPHVLNIPERLYRKGWHKIQLIGFEGCCDGVQSAQYKNRVGDWKIIDEGFCFGPCDE
jgi:hypothetical protein